MFTLGHVGWHYWPIYQLTLDWSVGQVLALYWPSLDWYTVDISADSQLSVGWVLIECQSSVSRVSIHYFNMHFLLSGAVLWDPQSLQ